VALQEGGGKEGGFADLLSVQSYPWEMFPMAGNKKKKGGVFAPCAKSQSPEKGNRFTFPGQYNLSGIGGGKERGIDETLSN